MKKLTLVLCIIVLSACLAFANGSGEKTEQTIKITLSDINNAETVQGKASQAFADLVKERSNGRIIIETFLGGQLGTEAENIQNLRTGAVGITRINVANLETRGIDVPEYSLFGLPYLFRSKQHAENYFYSEKGGKLADKIAEATGGEIHGLDAYLIAAPRSFFFKTDAHSMADVASKKVRSESTPMKVDMMSAFGMSATPMGLNDMYSALQTGMIDGGEHNISSFKSYAFYEQCPYVLLTKHNYNSNIYLISGTLVDKLSKEDLELINQCAKETCIEYSKLFEEDDAKVIDELKAKGINFNEPTDIKVWQDAASTLYEKYAAGYDAFIQEVLSFDK